MLSLLPEPEPEGLPDWATRIRDHDESWMQVAQRGVKSFIDHAMAHKAAFAMETVFSHWQPRPDGSVASKIDRILGMQRAGYFVLLLFVGLSSSALSIGRVTNRVAEGGHDVAEAKLLARFPARRAPSLQL